MNTSPMLLETQGLTKRYGRFTAVNGVDLRVRGGSIHAVIGPNGAGKTTLFHLLTGTVRATAGRIQFAGQDITAEPAHHRVRQGLARSFQVTSLFPTLSVQENLRLAAQGPASAQALNCWHTPIGARAHAATVDRVLAHIGLEPQAGTQAAALSHGQQRRLEVGMALAAKPRAIFLDEPTSGMGIDDLAAMKRLIHGLREAHTVVLIEHNMDIVMDISDTITVMQQGRVLTEGPPATVRADERVRRAYLGNMITGGRA